MIIGVAGPYSASTEAKRQANLDRLNAAGARLLERGHVPVIGMNAALPVLAHARVRDPYASTMSISLAVIMACDALLLIGASPGADQERDIILSQGKPVYRSLEEVPEA
jgi:hypothetical protein